MFIAVPLNKSAQPVNTLNSLHTLFHALDQTKRFRTMAKMGESEVFYLLSLISYINLLFRDILDFFEDSYSLNESLYTVLKGALPSSF